jgi:CHAD domain-containing protein
VHAAQDRVHIDAALCSRDAAAARVKLREQLEVFSYQWKTAESVFQTDRCALSGKIGGMKDDVVMAFMLGVYFSQLDRHQGNVPVTY